MSWTRPIFVVRAWNRFLFFLRRDQLSHELAQEVELHRELKEHENARAGISRDTAWELSRKQMGNVSQMQEESRDMWSFMRLERLLQDLRYSARMFRRTPGFTAVAALSLALGIGGNAAMFSLVDALLVRPLPYFEPERLVRVTGTYPRAAVAALQEQSRTMDIAAVTTGSEFNLTGEGEAARVVGSRASANFLAVLRSSVARGRAFKLIEDSPGRDNVVLLSNSLWQQKFGSDPSIVGRAIVLDGVHREIVGVMPPAFNYPSAKVQLWIPLRLDSSNVLEYWAMEFVPLIGRLHPGATAQQAQAEIKAMVAQFRGTFPYPMSRDWNADVSAIPLQQDLVADIRDKLIILLASVGIVLLIACANVASLLLSRATTRRKEIALRAALGAGRWRLVRQLLTESMALACVGGGLGILLGMSALSIFKSLLPASTPGLAQVSIDWHVALAVLALALLTGVAFGIAPALSASQIDLTDTLKTGSQKSTTGFWTRLRSWLIAAEVALTVVLVVSAGLLIKSLYSLSEAHPGFKPAYVLAVRITPNQFSCLQRSACVAFYDRLLDRARGIAGVGEAAVANSAPLDGELPTLPVDLEGHPKTADHPAPMLWFGAISPKYLDLLSIPLLSGRNFTDADSSQSARVVLISASTAKHFWPGENPIGKHMKPSGEKQWSTIIGVTADVRQYSLSKGLPAWVAGAVYMPYAQAVREDGQIPAAMTLLVKAPYDTTRVMSEVHHLAASQDPNVPVGSVQRLEDVVSGSIADFRSTMRVFISFALTAILLAAIGIYGLVSYWVTQRTYEIGLRVAIGATRQRIVSMILGQGLRVALYGVVAGLVIAVLLTRFLSSLLYGVVATDLFTFAAVTTLVLIVAITATSFPAWRASRIDPVKSLRAD